MNKNSIKLLQNWLNNYETIILHRHVRPDPDALGSQLAFKTLLKKMYPNKKVLAAGEMVDNLAFIGAMDDIEDADYENALVVVLDTANGPRIDDQRYSMGDKIVKIDHHPPVDQYGDINIVETQSSSTSEMIAELIIDFGYGQDYLNNDIAKCLYIGIVGDTGRFLFNNTSVRTMEIAGLLREYDFDHTAMINQMQQRSLKSIHFQGYVLQNFNYEDHVGSIFITLETLAQFDISANDASLFVNSMSDVEGIQAWVFAVDEGDQIRARIRSKRVSINELAARYNGGGHPMASGATVYSEQELNQLIAELKSIVN
ncbi:bifunctional oligoribonuclease/PAP phosphatase NrnA [Macrococcus hajekii]|uniref:Bifunctional oligoribonuclease/PAP phosphatase NrnA n=1 Tax=Macrococcus hajekii TaxID=198482 RepID=A0A4R6BM35_9STAP|nr:bifunctional oligoribonuclease/PAP phosphatase NrnA [Macrococcus hajekii]TDM02702.1 bifunctional oligoribonuclease/PAP phosphatase NrnA [Macrococcus hajekii]GGB03190.1 oligoribonuclease [Macrococcus hajekii]